jgi:metal-responsive CopG/Arc/MetJ family transcriptional regulator
VEDAVDQNPHVETIQVVMEDDLLRRVDKAARRLKMNRSALIREALRRHLGQLQARERADADRRGYERIPEDVDDPSIWSRVLAWPRD